MSKYLNIAGYFLFLCFLSQTTLYGQMNSTGKKSIASGEVWKDTDGNVINAHGGGILFNNGKYYWFGEHRPSSGFTTQVGVTC
ncbi:MAG: beta-glucanase, partial [Bacteroides oleiciplenus]|nr:beta-glucanase [Bacteroides oleiciplenus]